MELTGAGMLAATGALLVIFRDSTTAGQAGMALSYGLTLSSCLYYGK
jgi:hypothetical protein